MSWSSGTPSRWSSSSASTAVAAAPGSTRLSVPKRVLDGWWSTTISSRALPALPPSMAEPADGGDVERDHQLGRGRIVARPDQEVLSGQETQQPGHRGPVLPEGGRDALAHRAQGQPEGEHGAERVAVRRDVTGQRDLVRGRDELDGPVPVSTGHRRRRHAARGHHARECPARSEGSSSPSSNSSSSSSGLR